MVELGRGGGNADGKVRTVAFPLGAVEQRGFEVCAGATKSRIFLSLWEDSHGNFGKDWCCRFLLSMNTSKVAAFNLEFEMWVKSVGEMIPHELIPC